MAKSANPVKTTKAPSAESYSSPTKNISVRNEPGKVSAGDKMPHEVMNDKLAKGLGF
jgi:hypothetical protein